MLKKTILILIISLLCRFSMAQELKVVTVSAEAEVEFPDSRSKEEVKIEALSKAKASALEKAFGTTDIVGNSAYLKDVKKDKKTETEFIFSTMSNSFVKGEIIEIMDEKYEEIIGTATVNGKKRDVKYIKCSIRCKAREIPDAAAGFETMTLKCPDPGCQETKFKTKDPFFLYFKGTSEGYLMVFMQDQKAAQLIFPYSKMHAQYSTGMPVKAGQTYILFSRKKDFNYFGDLGLVDELEMTTDTENDHCRVFVLFSRNPISVPELEPGREKELLTPEEISKKYKVPEEMGFRHFNNWLTRARNLDRDLRLNTTDIIIQK